MSLYVKEIRGNVNTEITNEFASNLGTIIGNFLRAEKVAVVGRDNNTPSQMIKRSITSGIMAAGIDVFDCGISPIPAVFYSRDLYDACVVVTVTASHLHPEDITIKIFSDHKIPLVHKNPERVSWDKIGQLSYVHDYIDKYKNAVINNVNQEIIRDRYPKVILDCAKGLTTPITPGILSDLECEMILTGCQPADPFSRYAEPSPETLSLISNLVKAVGADMGIAMDNDRDRVVFIDEKGNIIRDQTILGIFARDALLDNPQGNIVSSVVASISLEEIVTKYGGKLIKTPVDLVLNGLEENNAIFGGDEPGMYVFPQIHHCFDAIFAAAKMLEIICKNDKHLSVLAKDLPEYPRTVFSVECEHDEKEKIIDSIKNVYESEGIIDYQDGIRVDWKDSFILVRPSRFEPLIRVYVEAKNPEKLQSISKNLNNLIKEI
ncbi:MAG: phosphomannomutase [Methanobacteriaceae archaeon]